MAEINLRPHFDWPMTIQEIAAELQEEQKKILYVLCQKNEKGIIEQNAEMYG